MNFWQALEEVPELSAYPKTWQSLLGDLYRPFQLLCLQPAPRPGTLYPCSHYCPEECRRALDIIPGDGPAGPLAVCPSQPPRYPDLALTIHDITPLEVHLEKLARALAKAFHCGFKFTDLKLVQTFQFGSWSAGSVPAILTIQYKEYPLHSIIAQLALRLRRPFLLFSPTTEFLDADCQELLADAASAFFSLDSTVDLNPDASLRALKPPDQLFSPFTPSSPFSLSFPTDKPSTLNPQPSTSSPPHYALTKGLGYWELIFNGEHTVIRHERGLFYVAWLLYHPDETPIHAIDLVAKIPELYRQQLGLPELVDPSTGMVAPLLSGARLQERSLALDDRDTMRALHKKALELEAILDSEETSEPEKAEALRELEQITEFQRQRGRGSRDSARRAAHAVRSAIGRLQERLRFATGEDGTPHAVLRSFADHVREQILVPSARYGGHGGPYARAGVAGCFTYERPSGVFWSG